MTIDKTVIENFKIEMLKSKKFYMNLVVEFVA